jgi:protein-S-isoprenylcysteine O-methyltransferase Ste14
MGRGRFTPSRPHEAARDFENPPDEKFLVVGETAACRNPERTAMPSLENRIPPPFVTLVVAVAMWGASFRSPPLVADSTVRYGFVAIFFLLGGLFGAPAFLAFGRAKTTIDPVHIDRAAVVVTDGIYRITRNPMYVGLTSLLVSLAAYLATPWSLLGPVFFVWFINRFQIIPEESAMIEKFGSAYADYKSRVRRWL